MTAQLAVIVIGLLLAGWGHFLVHDLLGVGDAWNRVDDMFPENLRSSPTFAGKALLMVGSTLVLAPVVS
jgi:hypothetical protein